MDTMDNKEKVTRILKAVADSVHLRGALIVECRGEGAKVLVTFCCVGCCRDISRTLNIVGMKVAVNGNWMSVRYPTSYERLRMQ